MKYAVRVGKYIALLLLMVCNSVLQFHNLGSWVGIVTGAIAVLVAYGIVRILLKMHRLQKERAISEG